MQSQLVVEIGGKPDARSGVRMAIVAWILTALYYFYQYALRSAPAVMEDVVSQQEMLRVIADRYGPVQPLQRDGSAPAERFRLPDGTAFGVIASTTAPFCRTCDRARLTADGTLLLCLYGERGLDLRGPLRQGMSDFEIMSQIEETWATRTDRGAEERAAVADRGVLHQIESLRADPRREMHTRGG